MAGSGDDWSPPSARPLEETDWAPKSARRLNAPTFTGKEERAAEEQKLLAGMGPLQRFMTSVGGGALDTLRNVQDITAFPGPAPGVRSPMAPDAQQWAAEGHASNLLGTTTEGKIGNVVGEILPTLPMGGGVAGLTKAVLPRALPRALASLLPLVAEGSAQGAVMGGPDGRGMGAGIGGGIAGLFGTLGLGGKALAQTFGRKAVSAEVAGLELAAKKAAQKTAQARSAAGQDATALYRTLEHLRELAGRATPQAQQELDALAARGINPASIEAKLHAKSVAKLAGDATAADESSAAYREAMASEPARAGDLADEIAQPSLGKDAWELFKMYGEPLLGAAAGTGLGNLFGHGALGGMGGTLGGLLLGRTRAGKAILSRLAKPGNQAALARFGRGASNFVGDILESPAPAPLGVAALGQRAAPALMPAFAGNNAPPPAGGQTQLADLLQRAGPASLARLFQPTETR